MPDARPLQPGDPARLGSYEVTGRLGEGGQGVVYLGRSQSGDPVAIKLLRADLAQDTVARGRFLRELAAVKKVARFCTAQVLAAEAEGDRPYIVSEYVPGPSLHQLVTGESPRSDAELERLAIGTVTALVAIHQAGIVHRDFKPQNVLIGPDGPRVIDFGIAKALDAAATMTNSAIGTPAYMAPEQLSGKEITPAADIFAWGSTMVFAATGQTPFGQDTVMAVIHRIMSEPPDLGSLHEPLRGIVADCLAKDPAVRPAAQQLLMRLLGQEGASGMGAAAGAPPTAILDQGAAFAETRIGGTRRMDDAAAVGAGAAAAATAAGDPGAPPTTPYVAAGAVTRPGTAARRGMSSRALMAALAAVVLVAGFAALIIWAAGRGGGDGNNPARVPSVAPSSGPSVSSAPVQPAPATSRSEPRYTPPPTTHHPTHTYTSPSEPTDTNTSTSTGEPTGGSTTSAPPDGGGGAQGGGAQKPGGGSTTQPPAN